MAAIAASGWPFLVAGDPPLSAAVVVGAAVIVGAAVVVGVAVVVGAAVIVRAAVVVGVTVVVGVAVVVGASVSPILMQKYLFLLLVMSTPGYRHMSYCCIKAHLILSCRCRLLHYGMALQSYHYC